jgi:hypothetical protein
MSARIRRTSAIGRGVGTDVGDPAVLGPAARAASSLRNVDVEHDRIQFLEDHRRSPGYTVDSRGRFAPASTLQALTNVRSARSALVI